MARDLNGIWECDNGGLYYVYHYQSSVWIAGLSSDGQFFNGLRFSSLFAGTMDADDVIRGRWAHVPRGTAANGGYVQLKVVYDAAGNAWSFYRTPAGDLGSGTLWTNRVAVESPRLGLYDRMNVVKKNDGSTLLDNLKPAKLFPVVVFGSILNYKPFLMYRSTDPRTYPDFLEVDGDDDRDGDLNFNLRVDLTMLSPTFWSKDWAAGSKITSVNFRRKLVNKHLDLHCELIMYGGTEENEGQTPYPYQPVFPGWQQPGGDSVLINGTPIAGDVLLTKKDDNFSYVNAIHGISTIFSRMPALVRVTGVMALDCGHGLTHPCYEDDPGEQNQEIHPVFSVDLLQPVANVNLTGAWTDRDGMTYYIRHIGMEVWWLAMSPALDRRKATGFYGSISSDGRQIQGTLVNLPLGIDWQGQPPSPPQAYRFAVEASRIRIRLPDGTPLFKMYNRDPGKIEPLDTYRRWPPVEKNPFG